MSSNKVPPNKPVVLIFELWKNNTCSTQLGNPTCRGPSRTLERLLQKGKKWLTYPLLQKSRQTKPSAGSVHFWTRICLPNAGKQMDAILRRGLVAKPNRTTQTLGMMFSKSLEPDHTHLQDSPEQKAPNLVGLLDPSRDTEITRKKTHHLWSPIQVAEPCTAAHNKALRPSPSTWFTCAPSWKPKPGALRCFSSLSLMSRFSVDHPSWTCYSIWVSTKKPHRRKNKWSSPSQVSNI